MKRYKYKLPRVVEWALLSYFGFIIYSIINIYRMQILNETSSMTELDVIVTTFGFAILLGNMAIVWIKRYPDITIRYFLLKMARLQLYSGFKSLSTFSARKEMALIIMSVNQLILEIYDV